ITQAAVYDSVVAIDGSFEPYHAEVNASRGASLQAAAAQAAHDSLSALFPAQTATFDAALAADLAEIPTRRARPGIGGGQEAPRPSPERGGGGGARPARPGPRGKAPGGWAAAPRRRPPRRWPRTGGT